MLTFALIGLEASLFAYPPTHQRDIPEKSIQEYQKKRDFKYNDAVPEVEEPSIWSQILNAISDFIQSLFGEEGAMTFWRALPYLLALVALFYILYYWSRHQRMSILSMDNAESSIDYLEIRKMPAPDIQALIDNAIAEHDYANALRWLYLRNLKKLEEKGLIDWKRDKTNHDYLWELRNSPLQADFKKLTRYFDYSFYGKNVVTADEFPELHKAFDHFYAQQ